MHQAHLHLARSLSFLSQGPLLVASLTIACLSSCEILGETKSSLALGQRELSLKEQSQPQS